MEMDIEGDEDGNDDGDGDGDDITLCASRLECRV